MIELRVTLPRRELFGGLLCPACSMIHGRCSDAVLPFMLLYSESGDEKYREAAIGVVDYAESNLKKPDGSYYNDVNQTWRGISVFSALALGETLKHFGDLIDTVTRKKWHEAYLRLTEASINIFDREYLSPNINYTAAMASLLAFSYKFTGEERYRNLALKYESICRARFDSRGLFVGEGKQKKDSTPKGCRPVDIGYNLEESLPHLVRAADELEDAEMLDFYKARTIDQLLLMLPDGGIDNSFGTRMNKWTYWGSRTSDGIMGGLSILAADEPVILRAISENLGLLRRSTHGGLLFGGPMYHSADEPPCIHHTFPHAKALAELYLNVDEALEADLTTPLPREKDGVRMLQSDNVAVISRGDLTATVNASDAVERDGEDSGGGAISLLYSKKRGPILAATLHTYRPSEPYNMQFQRNSLVTECMTARFVCGDYSSDLDRSVTLKNDGFTVTARSSKIPLTLIYRFLPDSVEIELLSKTDGEYILPIISPEGEEIHHKGLSVIFGSLLAVVSNSTPEIRLRQDGRRHFNQVGGFLFAPLVFKVSGGSPLSVKLSTNFN